MADGKQHLLGEGTTAIRGAVLTYTADPFLTNLNDCMVYESDAIVLIEDGKITDFGPAEELSSKLPSGVKITHYKDCLMMAGFIDCHVHYSQTQIIASYGKDLFDWLNKYTFVAEQRFSDKRHAVEVAQVYLDENLRNGTTTAAAYCAVYPQSVDALFEESEKRGMRIIGGKVMMDRNAPEGLLDTPQSSYDDSKALIEKWHGRGRALYAITPRFAPTSTPEQLELAGTLRKEHPTVFVQSHLSETRDEVAWVRELYPDRKGYLDVYEHYGLIGRRSIYGHGIYLTEEELQMAFDTETAIAHCPMSNLGLGSGLFNIENAKKPSRSVRVGLATDVGGGMSFSILQTMSYAHKAGQIQGYRLDAGRAFYLATRGSAQALDLEDRIGSIAPGMEADLVILDLYSTPIIKYRMKDAENLEEVLFIQMTLGDDRAVRATYVNGSLAYERTSVS
jgi:guanine deaminase